MNNDEYKIYQCKVNKDISGSTVDHCPFPNKDIPCMVRGGGNIPPNIWSIHIFRYVRYVD